jgi:putative methyltransferase (TIGR04325 family)
LGCCHIRGGTGVRSSHIIERVRAASLDAKAGRVAFERDSVRFEREAFWWPLLANLMYLATRNGRLHVADFGGSLGSSYFQHRKYLGGIRDLKWSIIEQPTYVDIGRAEFQDETLQFFPDLKQCAERAGIDVVIFSGSLHYLKEPGRVLQEAAEHASYILIDRTPFVDRETDRITLQSPPPAIYPALIPHRFFAKQKFDTMVEGIGLRQIAEWPGFDHEANIKSKYLGRLYVRR